ncbi:MAG: hypothetical protein CK429_01435 [Mycobacterium sp.]|nr:MAG: hypothetical protein CK429_01435 [Mycobacterium sp.]
MTGEDVSAGLRRYWRQRNTIVGAFWDIDFLLFDHILDSQAKRGVRGDLLEIGALYGKSAIVLGCHARPPEQVFICDIFDNHEGNGENIAENTASYQGLDRQKFESNYGRWVQQPPVVIAELSEHIVARIKAQTLRFAHIDGSHLFDVVRSDIKNVRSLMTSTGIVAVDDFRALHTPGVAAAVWESVSSDGLIPICVSEQKLYGCWSNETARSTSELLTAWAADHSQTYNYGIQSIAGVDVIIIQNAHTMSRMTKIQNLIRSKMKRGTPAGSPYLGAKRT